MAEGGKNWEFDCPQFYDFCNGVEDNTKNLFHLGGDLPDLDNKFTLKSKNYLKNKLATWNNKLSTPVNKSPFINTKRPANSTDSEKINERIKRLSKSEGSVNTVGVYKNVSTKQVLFHRGITRKRSLSESDTKPRKKFPVTPKKVPTTPACFKRTLNKARVKKLKTTEELELEKIAELQSLTLKHLRLNEQTMKKMKMKPKALTVPKIAPVKAEKPEKSASVKQFQKDLEEVVKKLNSNRNMRFEDQNRVKRERLKAVSCTSDVELPPSSSHTLQPSISSTLNRVKIAVDETDIERELSFMKNPAHSGLFFHVNNPKKAALKPFNFCDRAIDSGPELSKPSNKLNNAKENVRVMKMQFSHSLHKNRNKENDFCKKIIPKTDVGYGQKSFKY